MSHSKPLLIPWLRAEIDSAKYPGVFWTNPERTEFSIPWKHALRQDSCNTDVLIFKVNLSCIHCVPQRKKVSYRQPASPLQAWAEVSGGGRAHGEPSVWKRNFRSALRVKGFQMVSDDKNDAANPHKVFRWPGDPPPGGEDPPPSSTFTTTKGKRTISSDEQCFRNHPLTTMNVMTRV